MIRDEAGLRVLIVAPVGRDAVAMAELLQANGQRAHVCGGLRHAAACMQSGAGALLVTEEAIDREHIDALLERLDQQPAWSELPVIVLTARAESRAAERLTLLTAAAGSVTLLERPLGTATLLRTVEVALRSRRRQYEVRDLLAAQQAREAVLRDSEERLRLAIVALEEANQRKDAFLATLSHELRNPLAPIRNAAEVLASPQLTPIQLRWTQSVIQRQSAHMAWLLDDLLELTRITQGKLRLRKRRCTLRGLVDAAIETARPVLDRKGHELRVNLSDDDPEFVADPVRLAQAISNLLTNAAKYTDPGGSIELSGQVGKEVSIAVKDNGIGIPAEQLESLFTMFSQIPTAIGRSEGGLGVGLALVRGIVELHGGHVVAESAGPNQGSRFLLRLPFETPTASGEAPAQADTSIHPSGKLRVLIADDNRDAADSLSMVLAMDGYEVRTAYDGAEAVSAVRTYRPDVALLDIGMPGLDGYAAARSIREQRAGLEICLIAVTGWGQEEDKRQALEAGFDTHVTKPVDPHELRRLLRSLLTSSASRRSGESSD